MIANFFPIIFACCVWFGGEYDEATWAGFVALFGSMLVGVAVTTYFLSERMQEEPGKWTWRSIWFELSFSNIFALKNRVQPTIQYIPDIWAYLIKGAIPHLLIVVFVSAAATKIDGTNKFWHYGNYPTLPYQLMGVFTIIFALGLFVTGFFYPDIYAFLATAFEDDHRMEEKGGKELADSDEGSVEIVKPAEDEVEA
jgi:hypothetical protein